MIGPLNYEQIEEVLHDQLVGRIGCHLNGKTYIVPINYAYNDPYVYVYSLPGKKVEMMRQNNEVCFEVDEIYDMSNWKSVVAWGAFEELKGSDERQKALKILSNRSLPLLSSKTGEPSQRPLFEDDNINDIEGIFYRINLTEKNGRFKNSLPSNQDSLNDV